MYKKADIVNGINLFVLAAYNASCKSGWWKNPNGEAIALSDQLIATKLCLIHSEISEGLEAMRKSLKDDHLPHRDGLEVELADAMIRIADLAGAMGYNLGDAIVEKMEYNANRVDHKLEHRAGEGGKSI